MYVQYGTSSNEITHYPSYVNSLMVDLLVTYPLLHVIH